MARAKKEQQKNLTSAEMAELSKHHADLQIIALKHEICKLRGIVLQMQTKEQLRLIKDTEAALSRENEDIKKRLQALCADLGEKYSVNFEDIVYDDVSGEIKLP